MGSYIRFSYQPFREQRIMPYLWNYKFIYPYNPQSKYQRLYHAQKILELSRHVMLLDTVEPVEDLTEAAKYLNKFRLEK
jgi:hypothetical protein